MRLGVIDRSIAADPALALGSCDVTPLKLASMYATFSAGGSRSEPYMIRHIKDVRGHTLYRHHASKERVASKCVAPFALAPAGQVVRGY